MRVIPRTLTKPVIVGEKLPILAAVIRAINAAFLRFHDGPDAVRVCSGDSHADTSQDGFGQTVRLNFLPRRAAVAGAIQPASGSATIHAPRSALGLPERCEQNIGIAR